MWVTLTQKADRNQLFRYRERKYIFQPYVCGAPHQTLQPERKERSIEMHCTWVFTEANPKDVDWCLCLQHGSCFYQIPQNNDSSSIDSLGEVCGFTLHWERTCEKLTPLVERMERPIPPLISAIGKRKLGHRSKQEERFCVINTDRTYLPHITNSFERWKESNSSVRVPTELCCITASYGRPTSIVADNFILVALWLLIESIRNDKYVGSASAFITRQHTYLSLPSSAENGRRNTYSPPIAAVIWNRDSLESMLCWLVLSDATRKQMQFSHNWARCVYPMKFPCVP